MLLRTSPDVGRQAQRMAAPCCMVDQTIEGVNSTLKIARIGAISWGKGSPRGLEGSFAFQMPLIGSYL